MQLVGNDLLTPAATSASTWGIDLEPEQIVEELLDGVVARVERAGAVAAGRPSSCWPRCARPACRARW